MWRGRRAARGGVEGVREDLTVGADRREVDHEVIVGACAEADVVHVLGVDTNELEE